MCFWGPRPYYTGGSFEPKYDKTQSVLNNEFCQISRWMRSAIFKVWPYFITTSLVGLFSRQLLADAAAEWKNEYAFSAFGSILGFMLVFRTNIAYQRYWEARTVLEDFESKLTDVLIHSLALDRSSKALKGKKKMPEQQLKTLEAQHQRFKNIIAHLLSLMHAVAFCTLRDDFDLFNLTVHFSGTPLLVLDGAGNPFHPDVVDKRRKSTPTFWYHLRRALTFSQRDSTDREEPHKDENCPAKPLNDSFPRKSGDPDALESEGKWNGDEDIPGAILEARQHWGWQSLFNLRPGVGARGAADSRWMHRNSKLAVLGGLSAAEAISLGAPATDRRPWLQKHLQIHRKRFDEGVNEQARCIPWLAETGNSSFDDGGNLKHTFADEVKHLPAARERVQVIHSWLVDELTEHFSLCTGRSRNETAQGCILQFLSSAMLAYQNCRKLSTHQLPWGWYQACHFSLWAFTVFMPLVVGNSWVQMLGSVLVVCVFATLHEVANYIEEPFRFYPNLIPLQLKQVTFNERILAIMDTRRPMGPSDVFENITNPVPLQACRWLTQKGRVSLGNLRCTDPNFSENTATSFEFEQHVDSSKYGKKISTAQHSQQSTRSRVPLPRHQLVPGDRVKIHFDAARGGQHEAIHEEPVVDGTVTYKDDYRIVVEVAIEELQNYRESTSHYNATGNCLRNCLTTKLPGKYFSIQKIGSQFEDECFGCNNYSTMKKQPEPSTPQTARFKTRDEDCWEALKKHQLQDRNLPDPHALTLYRHMDISRCRLCTSICDTLETRNTHWVNEGFFDPLLHDTRCKSAEHCSDSSSRGTEYTWGSGSSQQSGAGAQNNRHVKQYHHQQSVRASQKHYSKGTEQQGGIPRLGLDEKQIQQLHGQYAPSSLYKSSCKHQDMEQDACVHHQAPETSCSQPTCGCVQDDCACSWPVGKRQEQVCNLESHETRPKTSGAIHTSGTQTGAKADRCNAQPAQLQIRTGKQHREAPGPAYKEDSSFNPISKQHSSKHCDAGVSSSQTHPAVSAAVQPEALAEKGRTQNSCTRTQGRPQQQFRQSSRLRQPAVCTHASSSCSQDSDMAFEPQHVHCQSSPSLILNPTFEGPTSVRVDR